MARVRISISLDSEKEKEKEMLEFLEDSFNKQATIKEALWRMISSKTGPGEELKEEVIDKIEVEDDSLLDFN